MFAHAPYVIFPKADVTCLLKLYGKSIGLSPVTYLCRCHFHFELCPRSCWAGEAVQMLACRTWNGSRSQTEKVAVWSMGVSEDVDFICSYLLPFFTDSIVPSLSHCTGLYFSALEEDTSCKWLRGSDPEIRQKWIKMLFPSFLRFYKSYVKYHCGA